MCLVEALKPFHAAVAEQETQLGFIMRRSISRIEKPGIDVLSESAGHIGGAKIKDKSFVARGVSLMDAANAEKHKEEQR
jgi:hypothetical protein